MADLPGRPAPAPAVAGNALWMAGGELTAKVASIVFVVIVARAIGVQEYGWFTFATAFAPLLLVVGSLGLHQAVVRELVADGARTSEVFASGMAVRLLTGVVAVVLAAGLAPLLMSGAAATATVAVVAVALFLDSAISYLSSLFEAHGSVRTWAVALVVNRVGSTVLALAAYGVGTGLPGVLAAYLAGSAAGLLYGLAAVRRAFPEVRLRDARRATAWRLLRQGAPLGVAGLLSMALLRADTLLVAGLLGVTAVGLYGVAFRFYESFLFVAYALGDATFPRYARQGPVRESARALEACVTVALSCYVPLVVLLSFGAAAVVELVFGARYADAAPAVPLLTLAAALYAMTYQARSAAVAFGARGAMVGVAAISLTTNVALNLVLIPTHGIAGAAAGTACAAGLETVLTLLVLRRTGLRPRYGRAAALPLGAGALAGGALLLLGLDDGAAVVTGAGLYLLVLLAGTRLLPREQRDWIRGFAQRGRREPDGRLP